jgi:hypothetical protein
MKVSWFGWSLLSLLAVPTLAAPSESETKAGNRLEKRRNNRGVDAEEPSIFNGLDVPPLLQLTPDNYEELLKDGTWSEPSALQNIASLVLDHTNYLQARQALFTIMRPLQEGCACLPDHI